MEQSAEIQAILAKSVVDLDDAEIGKLLTFRRAELAEKTAALENSKYEPSENAVRDAILAVLDAENMLTSVSFNVHYTPGTAEVAEVAEVTAEDGTVTPGTPAVAAIPAEITVKRGAASVKRQPTSGDTAGGTRKSQGDPFTIGELSKKAIAAFPQLAVGQTYESAQALQDKLGIPSAMVTKTGEQPKAQPGRYTLRTAGIVEQKAA